MKTRIIFSNGQFEFLPTPFYSEALTSLGWHPEKRREYRLQV